MSAGANEKLGFLRQVDILVMFGALVALFVALGSEPWWTLTGTATSSLLSVQVSPFYLHINALGLPPTVSAANNLGSFTRVLLILGSLALFAASIQPTSWWRNLAVYFGLSSLVELYLSFVLIYYWAETAIVQAYGVVPPYYGTAALQGSILGLDLKYYSAPLVTASFYFPYYLGFVSLGLVVGRSLIKIVHERAFQVLTALLPGGRIHDVYLSPPYQHVWFSSNDKEFNPLGKDPEVLNDDELLVSFQKLFDTVPGRPENQLRFRKPVQEQSASPIVKPAIEEPAPVSPLLPPAMPAEKALDLEPPRVLEIAQTPAWRNARMTRPERAILKSAVTTITARQEAVPYRELLNQVYMELVDKKVDFDSARQIETTPLNNNGREILLIEEADETGTRVLQKWWLGEQQVAPEKPRRLPFLGKIARARPKLPRPQGLLTRFQKPRYEHHGTDDGDSDSEQSSS